MIYGMSTERRRSYSEIESNKLLLRETTWAGLEDVTVGRSHADARADTLRGVGEVDAQRSGQQREELVEAGHGTRTRGARGGARVRVREAPV